MPAALLAIGDIHLGRRPARLPADLGALGLSADDVTPGAAWQRAVRVAIERRVDAVVLAGDVVESLADRFRALAIIERGLRDLAARDIPVFAVAGNHDVEALPRLAQMIEGFRLLGPGGRWQVERFEGRDGTRVRLAGWSFTGERARDNPLDTLRLAPDGREATCGLLHCDVDGGASPYAPVPRVQLVDAPVDAWLLGHRHRPDALSGPRPIGYLGSLTPLDPGESGERGAWLVTVHGPGRVEVERVPCAPLRYEAVELGADAFADVPDEAVAERAEGVVREALDRTVQRLAPSLGGTSLIGCRVRFTGRMAPHRALRRAIAGRLLDEITLQRDGVTAFVEALVDDAAPALDLEALAATDDPPGLVARRLLALDGDTDESRQLVERVRRRLLEIADGPPWSRAGVEFPPIDVVEIVRRAGIEALEELLAQGGEARGR